MRNLKRALSLALAAMMLIGMMVVCHDADRHDGRLRRRGYQGFHR